MGDNLSMSEIGTITALLQDMNKSLGDLHKDFGDFKGEVRASLTDTNGKLKGNHELIMQKIDSIVTESSLHDEILENKIENNTDDITTIKEALKPVGSNSIKINIIWGALAVIASALIYSIFA
jgi:hypothetical protein